MNRAICAPCGGLMNHVRWLLILSPEFNLFNWSITDKVNFVLNQVYPENRSPLFWLKHEYKFRERPTIQKTFLARHSIDDCINKTISKILALVVNPELSFRHYLKFNPGLNGLVKQATTNTTSNISHIKKMYELAISNDNDHNILCSNGNNDILTQNIDNLYTNRDLDLTIYKAMINFFELSNQYNEANQIHNRWFDLQRNGEKIIRSLPIDAMSVDSYWRLPNNEAITQAEYNIALELIKETYGE